MPTTNPLALLTVSCTAAVAPTGTGNVTPLPEVSVKASLLGVTVRFTGVVIDAEPLVPVTVMACAPDGIAIFAAVEIVMTTVAALEPFSVTLFGLKLHSAPTGRPDEQLPGKNAVEFVKVTVPVNPAAGVTVIVVATEPPAATLRLTLRGVVDRVNGVVTFTVIPDEAARLWAASPIYVAVTVFVPTGRAPVVNVAVPFAAEGYGVFKVAFPSAVFVPLVRVEKLTEPTTLVDAVTTTANEMFVPPKIVVDDGVTVIELDAREPSQVVARALAFTDPNPVTWSYPVPALKPNWNGEVVGQSGLGFAHGTLLLPTVTSLKGEEAPAAKL